MQDLIGRIAQEYAKLGWHVFPVSPTKTPLTPNGHLNATNDPKRISKWWEKFPDANIGVSVGPSNLVVLDIDNKGREGTPLEDLVKRVGEFPMGVMAKTGNDGLHLFYSTADTTIRSTSKFLGIPNIDVKAGSGYVIVAPSSIIRVDGGLGLYEWIKDPFHAPLEEAPDFLKVTTRSVQFQMGPVGEGNRNMLLTSSAGHLRAAGLEGEALYQALININRTRCTPPLDEGEVRAIVKSISTYPPYQTNGRLQHIDQEALVGDTPAPSDTPVQVTIDLPHIEQILEYEHSDKGLARMLSFILGDRLRYNHSRGKWYLWQGNWWGEDDVDEVTQLFLGVTDLYTRAIAFLDDDEEREMQAYKWARTISNRARLISGGELLKSDPIISTNERRWNADPDLLGVTNGVVDLKEGVHRPGKPEDYINTMSSVAYDAEAKSPRWLTFLDEVFMGDAQVIQFVQTAMGYTLTGHNSEQCLFLLVGSGANGKSVFLDTLHYIMGSYGHSAPFTTFIRAPVVGDRSMNDIALMAGKRFVVASEANEGVAFDTARLKALTGGERIAARFLYQEFFEFDPIVRIWLGVNHLPMVKDDSDGFWRRVHRINFDRKFLPHEQDRDLKYTLRNEAAGILNWALVGAQRWYTQGLSVPDKIRHATSVYRIDSDPLASFIEEVCIVDPNAQVEERDLYPAYLTYMHNRKAKPHEVLAANKFHTHLRSKFKRPIDADPSDHRALYFGLKLNPHAPKEVPSMTIVRNKPKEA